MRRKTKRTTLPLGSISTGSLREEDIFPALADELSALRLSRADRAKLRSLVREFDEPEDRNDGASDGEILFDLYDLAEAYAPDYCYVGSHPGNGSDIGVWVVEDLFHDTHPGGFDGFVARSRESARPDETHALESNDHGNATLWRRSGRRWVEVWSVV